MSTLASGPRFRRLNAHFGAEVTGVDLTADLDPATIAELRAAWLEHQVLLFPGQHLDPAGQARFAAGIGELTAGSAVLSPIEVDSPVVAFDSRSFRSDDGYHRVQLRGTRPVGTGDGVGVGVGVGVA
ncbi:TauD/TfdA dioxygenase family protein [Frankia umida]|uniref:TauD/TfdA dioxygenase family protein n=1 Tax=Frankia umida TaxID=573489 RepID=UPI0024B1944D|nr:TauD/TfdA family dioxygenase [Frankia umida]